MKRVFDVILSLAALGIFFLPMMIIAFLVRLTSAGPAIHWSKRIGRNNKLFLMPKFRSMKTNTPQLATHLLSESTSYITSVGAFLRKTSLDELPQLWSVLKGDMSVVGPRPALFNQDDLVALRTRYNVHTLRPGITGWAQVNGRDELPVPIKVNFDKEYLEKQSLMFDFSILIRTVCNVIKREGIRH
jgi:O-antigen biosynthesis protein WbqP